MKTIKSLLNHCLRNGYQFMIAKNMSDDVKEFTTSN